MKGRSKMVGEIFALGGLISGALAQDRPVDLGYFKGPFMPQNGRMEVCNGAKYLENIATSDGWYLTDGLLFNTYQYDYYLTAPGFFLPIKEAHEYCDSLGARLWCPDHPDELEVVELSFKKKLNFQEWKADATTGIATGLAYMPSDPEQAFCMSLPYDDAQVELSAVVEEVFQNFKSEFFEAKNFWHTGSMQGTNKYPEYENGIYLGGHQKSTKTGKHKSGSFRSTTLASDIPRPFLCQIMCPGSQTSYADFNLYQDSDATKIDQDAQSQSEGSGKNDNESVVVEESAADTSIPHEEVSWKFPAAGNHLIERFLNETVMAKIQTHGCWCHKMNPYHEDYVGGREYLDDLDYLCKMWFQTRRCTKINEGSCENEHNKGTYKLVDDYDCTALNLNKCALDSCLTDTHYILKIQEFFDYLPLWEPTEGSAETCVKGDGNGKNAGKKKYCTGTAPDLYIAFEN